MSTKTQQTKPIAYQVGRSSSFVHAKCWSEFAKESKASGLTPAIGDLWGPDKQIKGKPCAHCGLWIW